MRPFVISRLIALKSLGHKKANAGAGGGVLMIENAPENVSCDVAWYDRTSGRLISAANFGQSGLARGGSAIAFLEMAATRKSRPAMAFSYQSAARSISPQQVWNCVLRPLTTQSNSANGRWELVAFSQNSQFVSW